ncbi:PREDICTED: MARCKS-related protein [Galeopterus variegatus]|uniref:MARCKS-related protein n=1 Tax=Galeopterus variegatus TaxID=482537 RepID=A0ABM0R774_GALVR|nr:PREDICTED: MARCKS-related protein [Galeopterus variegatus]
MDTMLFTETAHFVVNFLLSRRPRATIPHRLDQELCFCGSRGLALPAPASRRSLGNYWPGPQRRRPRGAAWRWPARNLLLLRPVATNLAQENGHVKSNGDLSPKGEGESPPVNGTDEAAGATVDAIEPAPPSQGAEGKGEVPPKETPKKKKKFSFKKPFKLSGLSFKRNRKEGGGDSSASSPTEEEQEQGEIGACSDEGTAQEGKAVATPESQEPQTKGAEASAASKGGDTEEEAGPQAAEPSTPSGPESGPTPANAENE